MSRNISCKGGHNDGRKWQRPNRSKRVYKKRWEEYTELYKKVLNGTQITTML